jgi:hypothetical protein
MNARALPVFKTGAINHSATPPKPTASAGAEAPSSKEARTLAGGLFILNRAARDGRLFTNRTARHGGMFTRAYGLAGAGAFGTLAAGRRANIRRANIRRANIRRANIRRANITQRSARQLGD